MTTKEEKEHSIKVRLSAEAKAQIEHAATLQGRTVSDFVAAAALERATKVIEQRIVIHLTEEESVSLADLMNSEALPNEKAIAAVQLFKETMDG